MLSASASSSASSSSSCSPIPIPRSSLPLTTAAPAALSSTSSSSNVMVSHLGSIHVLSYTPLEGECGVPITVRIHFQPNTHEPRFVRLIVGPRAIATQVHELPDSSYGRWELDGIIPASDSLSSHKVLLSVQALNDNHEVLDSVVFGEFFYWSSSSSLESLKKCNTASLLDHKVSSSLPEMSTRRRSAAFRQSSRSPISTVSPLSGCHRSRLHRRIKSQSPHIQNPVNNDSSERLYAQIPILQFATSPATMCHNWSPEEVHAGRRLVRFFKVQCGCRLIVSCAAILQDEYCENDSVISCIYHEETDTCVFTSVDIIFLLEWLTGSWFSVEEKNRTRRNLQGFGPKTVSKHKAGMGGFFQVIMEFTEPRPRNIEKDLKVFSWDLLPQALDKVLSKYTFYIDTTQDSDEPASIETSSAVGPRFNSLEVPLHNQGQAALPIPISTKRESLSDEPPFVSPSSGSDTFSSPDSPTTTSPTTSVYPLMADLPQPVENTCPFGFTDFKPNDHQEFGLDSVNMLYDVGTGNPTIPASPNESTPYDYRFCGNYWSDDFDSTTTGNDALGSMSNFMFESYSPPINHYNKGTGTLVLS